MINYYYATAYVNYVHANYKGENRKPVVITSNNRTELHFAWKKQAQGVYSPLRN